MCKLHLGNRFCCIIFFSVTTSIFLPTIFSATSSLELSTLSGPVLQKNPPTSEAQRLEFLTHMDPRSSPPLPPGDAELKTNTLNDETTNEKNEKSPIQGVIDSPSLWSIRDIEDPRHLVVNCQIDHTWVWTNSHLSDWRRTVRIGRVVTTNWEQDRFDSLATNDKAEALFMLTQLNPKEIGTRIDIEDMESWSIFSSYPNDEWEWKVAVEQQWGWPFRSTFSVLWLESVGPMRLHRGYKPLAEYGQTNNYPTYALLVGKKESPGLLTDSRHLALGLIPFGLFGNFVIYTTAAWLLLTMITKLKQKLRLRRGQCPSCCYQLNSELSLGCPECGWLRNQPSG